MNIYVGSTAKISGKEVKTVTVGGRPLVSEHLIEHKCSFNWGYLGHGSNYLAEALLFNLGYNNKFVSDNRGKVAGTFIAGLPDNWEFTESELRNKISQIIAQ